MIILLRSHHPLQAAHGVQNDRVAPSRLVYATKEHVKFFRVSVAHFKDAAVAGGQQDGAISVLILRKYERRHAYELLHLMKHVNDGLSIYTATSRRTGR